MSKYIIELGEDANMVQVISVTPSGNAYIDSTVYVGHLEQLNSDYINEHFGDLQGEAYKRGFEDGKASDDKGCMGCAYVELKESDEPCVRCSNCYKNRYQPKKKDDEIKVGDIVERYLNGKLDSTGIYLGEDGDYWNCLFWTGTVFGTFAYPKNQFKKTGRHVDIESILEDMRE